MKKWTYANESQNAYVRFLNLLSANRNQTSTYREVRTKIKREYWNKYPKWENLHRVLLLFSVKYVVIEMLKRRKNGFFCCLRPHGRSGLKWELVTQENVLTMSPSTRAEWIEMRATARTIPAQNLHLHKWLLQSFGGAIPWKLTGRRHIFYAILFQEEGFSSETKRHGLQIKSVCNWENLFTSRCSAQMEC